MLCLIKMNKDDIFEMIRCDLLLGRVHAVLHHFHIPHQCNRIGGGGGGGVIVVFN